MTAALVEVLAAHLPRNPPTPLRRNAFGCSCGRVWSPEHLAAVLTPWLEEHDAAVRIEDHRRLTNIIQLGDQSDLDRYPAANRREHPT